MKYHYHKNEQGFLVKCYHNTKGLLTNWQFWIGVTLSFPIEHFIWEKVPPFSWLAKYIGL